MGAWTHVPPITLLDPERLRRSRLPLRSTIDNVCNVLPPAIRYYRAFKRERINLV